MTKKSVIIKGVVKEVRIFDKSVILFVTVIAPEKIRERVVRYAVSCYNSHCTRDLAELSVGDEVTIKQTWDVVTPGNPYYSLEEVKSDILDSKEEGVIALG